MDDGNRVEYCGKASAKPSPADVAPSAHVRDKSPFLYVRERKVVINRYFPSVFIPPFAHDALCIAISCGRERKVVCEWRLQPADVPLFCSRPPIIAPEPLFLRRILPTFGSVG